MIVVNSHGGSKSQRSLSEAAATWYIKKYLPKIKKLDIDIEIKKIKDDHDVNGLCLEHGHRQYNIELSSTLSTKRDVFEFVATVMHEMIHVKQYVNSEITTMDNGNIKWKSRTYNPNNICYWEHPWEKEAHKYCEAFADKFMIETGKW